uniref:SOUL heme-binding protein n=1 Tax=Kalanchoe fedtschenkoi TaxID=63787 RepID=A0A7N1A2N4_KALFE
MGLVFGKITVETPKYDVLKRTTDYEIRRYAPSVIAQVTYDPSEFKNKKDGGFMILANYIGALGNPQNVKPEKIAMTAPVITKEEAGEKIAMTPPVITREEAKEAEKIEMTAPVVTKEKGKLVTMQFVLPDKYKKAEEAPRPVDERVEIREEGERVYGVVRFSGVATEQVVEEKVRKLKEQLEKDGVKVVGEHLLGRYNPPWTIPAFRTNEVMIPVEFSQ